MCSVHLQDSPVSLTSNASAADSPGPPLIDHPLLFGARYKSKVISFDWIGPGYLSITPLYAHLSGVLCQPADFQHMALQNEMK